MVRAAVQAVALVTTMRSHMSTLRWMSSWVLSSAEEHVVDDRSWQMVERDGSVFMEFRLCVPTPEKKINPRIKKIPPASAVPKAFVRTLETTFELHYATVEL